MRIVLARPLVLAACIAAMIAPGAAFACACGCGIFDVGAASLPTEGGIVYFRYDYMNQNRNQEGVHRAPDIDNGDKWLNTSFYTIGSDYLINDNWMIMAELPIYARQLETTDDGFGSVTGTPYGVYTGHLTDFGDAQISGVYTGFSQDQSTGLTFGVKLPTGNYVGPTGPNGGLEFDRDSLPGTGSTDLMIGGYHVGALTNDQALGYFVQARYQFAVLTRDSYRPGNELDSAAGLSYDFGVYGPFDKTAVLLQALDSYRQRDAGANADPQNSGYERVLIAPGIDLQVKNVRFFADVELPVYQDFNASWNGGYSVATGGTKGQLVASALYKVELAYAF